MRGTETENRHIVDLIAVGFGATAAMWALGYFLRLPVIGAPPWLLLAMFLVVLFGAGHVVSAKTQRGWTGGMWVGGISSTLNLLILGSLLSGGKGGMVAPSALIWLPGSILLGAIVGAIGALTGIAARKRVEIAPAPASVWLGKFAWVLAFETLVLLLAGGIVTSADAGLSVPDWPSSFAYNMFLFPLSRMTGGVYFEHAHRLLGSLVGITAIVFVILMFTVERRVWLRWLSAILLLLVVGQGILGGMRVTEALVPGELLKAQGERPDLWLAIAHGVLGQIIFSLVVAHIVFLSAVWMAQSGKPPASARNDKNLGIILVLLLILQITFGAVLRHVTGGLHIHITLAVIVLVFGILTGVRAWGVYTAFPRIQKLGTALMHTLGVQVALGIAALIFTGGTAGGPAMEALRVIVPTIHQMTGAILLALSVALTLFFAGVAGLGSRKEADPS